MTIQQIKAQFNDEKLFLLALTHRSWINENPGIRESNERLEFLGDAVLELVVSHAIYLQFPDQEEGFLTSIRANIVNTINLAKVARALNLGEDLLLSRGEEQGGGRDNQSLLADTVEAIIGAVYLDQGFDAAKAFIESNILFDIQSHLEKPLKDAKSRLQEFVQANGSNAPKYRVVDEHGPDHAKEFIIEVSVDGNALGKGEGKSKSAAEQDAAEHALETLTKKA
ncbi:ribonuclease III [Candidatus Woesebacteria bacterium]|jgi:ribonuclease-3|nr:ribonuclease III [Candidatus Woesebacteria bacterium]MBP9687537.1 ribonuclease III [Candidatus Woesebacteria bacterium]